MKAPKFIYGRTSKCCICYAIATNWNGWLKKSRDGIDAGFCEMHKPEEPNIKNTYGEHNYRGIYKKSMGETVSKLSGDKIMEKYGLAKNTIEQ